MNSKHVPGIEESGPGPTLQRLCVACRYFHALLSRASQPTQTASASDCEYTRCLEKGWRVLSTPVGVGVGEIVGGEVRAEVTVGGGV